MVQAPFFAAILAALAFNRQNTVQSGGGDPQPLGHGDVILHGLIHRTAADHQHRSAAEIVAGHVDPVLMLLGDAVLQKQRQEQKRADRRKSGLVDQAAVFGGVFGVLKLVVAPMGGDIRKRAFHAKLLSPHVRGAEKAALMSRLRKGRD